jgi:hypothetical protein
VKDLSEMTEKEGLRRLWALGKVEEPWSEQPSDWSGLVELQRLFRKKKP